MATDWILLTHTPDMRRNYYGDAALAGLSGLGRVRLHEESTPLDTHSLVAAAKGCRFVVADRNTPVPAEVFAALPELAAVLRVAVDIRNIDVAAASRVGVLVTQASRSWVAAVSELTIGLMIAVARDVATASAVARAGGAPPVRTGRQLAGATAGVIGYGPLGRRVAELCRAFGMTVIVTDPYVVVDQPGIAQVSLSDLLQQSDFVLPLAVAIFRGTSPAMNMAVAIYVAYLTGTPLSAWTLAAGVLVAFLVSLSSVSLPGTLSFVVSVGPIAMAMGVPIEPLALLVAVEMLPDIMRTLGNVTADVAVTAAVDRNDERTGAQQSIAG
jgi:hypothetical protein